MRPFVALSAAAVALGCYLVFAWQRRVTRRDNIRRHIMELILAWRLSARENGAVHRNIAQHLNRLTFKYSADEAAAAATAAPMGKHSADEAAPATAEPMGKRSSGLWSAEARAARAAHTATAQHLAVSKYQDLRFVPLDEFRALSEMPRCGSATAFSHPVTGAPNMNKARPFETFPRARTAFVFVSHRWLRPAVGTKGHPDDGANRKHHLVVAACERLLRALPKKVGARRRELGKEELKIALWIDFCCVDQDGDPAIELETNMASLIGLCDVVLTPVVDPEHAAWALRTSHRDGWQLPDHEDYAAAGWTEYWSRAWCRIESFLAANMPRPDAGAAEAAADGATEAAVGGPVVASSDSLRAANFRGTLLGLAIAAGRRTHMLYGTKELDERRDPILLAPMVNETFARFDPEKGALTCEADRRIIHSITQQARSHARVNTSYTGELDAERRPHGHGRRVYEDGNVYEGQWAHGAPHGKGTLTELWGDHCEGTWVNGEQHGEFVHSYATGGCYRGPIVRGLREGYGRFEYNSGDTFEGWYRRDRSLIGVRHAAATGEARVGRWQAGGLLYPPKMIGEGALWSADRNSAWRLVDGDQREPISLAEACVIAGSLRLEPVPPPLPEIANRGDLY